MHSSPVAKVDANMTCWRSWPHIGATGELFAHPEVAKAAVSTGAHAKGYTVAMEAIMNEDVFQRQQASQITQDASGWRPARVEKAVRPGLAEGSSRATKSFPPRPRSRSAACGLLARDQGRDRAE